MNFVKAFHAVPLAPEDQSLYLLVQIISIIIMWCCVWERVIPRRCFVNSLTETYPDCIAIYQDDVAIAAETIEKTKMIAILVKQQMKLAGLKCNEEKTHWSPAETKPLLGAIWSLYPVVAVNDKSNVYSAVIEKSIGIHSASVLLSTD
eukprot:GHVP01066587.1.p1 GENE.GHVP01066587.1~~GHVP01066587.1.p1  ORF type:complete len:148 (-),score=11.21 GHVP01066587.1:221-664(-)